MSLNVGLFSFVKIIDADIAFNVPILPFVCCNGGDCTDAVDRFSLRYSTTIGWFCLIDTRRSVFFTLPECLRIESRRATTGELANDGHSLTDGKGNSLRSEVQIEKRMTKFTWILIKYWEILNRSKQLNKLFFH